MALKKQESVKQHVLHIKITAEEFKHFSSMAKDEERSVHFISRRALLKGSGYKAQPIRQ